MYRDFWRIFIKDYGGLRAGLTIVFLTAAVSLLEGLNIALLVPLLESLGSTTGEESHWVSRAVAGLFGRMGIPLGLKSILITLGILTLAMAGLKYLRHLVMVRTSSSFVVWLRTWNMWNLLNADLSHFHRRRIGVLTDTLMTQSGRSGTCLVQATQILTNLGVVVAYLGAAFLITPLLTTGAVALLILVSLSTQQILNQATKMGTRVVEEENNLNALAVEDLSGIRVIKGFLIERLRWAEYQRRAEDVKDATVRVGMNAQRMAFVQETAAFGLIGVLLFVGAAIMGLELAVLLTLLFVLFRLAPRVTNINNSRHALAVAMASLQNVDTAIQSTANPNVVSGETQFVGLETAIELQDLDFSYNGSSEVLKNINFTIEKGMTTAIVGASGAGKSTLMDLLLRYYDPVRGRVSVDGIDLKELDIASWRSAIGVVSQDIFLFNDTIANNIALGREGASQEGIIEAAGQAYAHDFITEFPLGYETLVGDRGLNLSGGERQRIALARAILSRPEILILDEATSSLDSESENLIRRYMRQIHGTCTMVVVAHRLSTIQDADKIVVLRDGEIAEQGDWDTLVGGEGVFANYHRLQTGS